MTTSFSDPERFDDCRAFDVEGLVPLPRPYWHVVAEPGYAPLANATIMLIRLVGQGWAIVADRWSADGRRREWWLAQRQVT